MKVRIKLTRPGAIMPEYKSADASGVDLHAWCQNAAGNFIPARGQWIIPTGLSVEIPRGYEGQVRSRSGLAAKSGIFVLNSPGTIDSDYRGEIQVILANMSEIDFLVKPGDRIAQLIICPVVRASFELAEELSDTERGDGGFGSTGVEK